MFWGKVTNKSQTFDDSGISIPEVESVLSRESFQRHALSRSGARSSSLAGEAGRQYFTGADDAQDAQDFQRVEAIVEEIERRLRLAVRLERENLTTILQLLVANTVGTCDTDSFNCRLALNPSIALGLLEAMTIGAKRVVYSISAIKELPNLIRGRGLGVADLDHDLPERIAVISHDWSYDIGGDKTLCIEVSILQRDQLRAVAQASVPNEVKALASGGFITFTMNRAYRGLEDPRRADVDSAPDATCYLQNLSSRKCFEDFKRLLGSESLYAAPC